MTSFPGHARRATHVKRRMRPTRSPSNGSPTLAMGYPSHRSGLANLQRDNQMPRRRDPTPSRCPAGPPQGWFGPQGGGTDTPFHWLTRPVPGCQPPPQLTGAGCLPEPLPSHTSTIRAAGPALAGPMLDPSSLACAQSARLPRALRRTPVREGALIPQSNSWSLTPSHNGSGAMFRPPSRALIG